MHPLSERQVKIGVFVIAIIFDWFRRPGNAAFGTEFHHVGGQPVLCDHRATCFDQFVVARNHLAGCLGCAHFGEHRLGRSHAQRIAVVGAQVHDATFGDFVHVFALAAECTEWQAATDGFGEGNQIGFDTKDPSSARPTSGDAGFYFVKHEQRAVPAGDFAHGLQVSILRHADADVLHDWLDDERSNVAASQRTLERFGIVVRDHDGVTHDALGDAC